MARLSPITDEPMRAGQEEEEEEEEEGKAYEKSLKLHYTMSMATGKLLQLH